MTKGNNFVLIAWLVVWTGTIFDLFQLPGKISEFNKFRNIIHNGFAIAESQFFIIFVEMLPWPWICFLFYARMSFIVF